MEKIKVGVIGLGWFGEHHIDTFQSIPCVEVSAICTRRPEHLKMIAQKYGVNKTYTDYKDILSDKDIDMVSIVTHVKDHMEPAIAAIKAGKHVFLEKPMADTTEECDLIIEALKDTEKFFMVGHICRFDTAYALAKQEIDAGNIGKIISIHAKRNLAKWITESHLSKISALFGDGIHDYDLMLWYTGAKPKTVYAQTVNTRPGLKYDDVAWALFRLDNGAFAVIENIWSLPDNVPYAIDAKMEIVGTKGAIDIDNSGKNYTVLTKNGLSFPQSTYWPKVHDIRRGYLKEELEYFVKCIINNKKPEVITPRESRDAVHGMRMAEKSAMENRVIEF
ncbi:MAG: Gfo/Idh/MocA family oxidoreductase [Actinobacteria bacterium]|nr:Gfo/Idh/MocA family oxidoreductase [Actinomycetota bacterium]